MSYSVLRRKAGFQMEIPKGIPQGLKCLRENSSQ
jgi:hypothetical protein